MVYIGIDSSLSCTAVGIISRDGAGNPKLLSFLKIPTAPDMDYIERCEEITDKIGELLKPYIERSKKIKTQLQIGIEMPNSFRGGDVTRKLCGLYGIILYYIHNELGVRPIEINTKHAKKVATGSGNADKQRTIFNINKIFGLTLEYSATKNKSDDDVADALSIAYCLLIEDGKRKTIKKKRRHG